jgi:glycogen(starch) synthase
MRVIFWTELFWPYIGGVQVLGTKLILALRERGYEFAIVTSHGALDLPDQDTYRGVPIHRFHFWKALATREMDMVIEAKQQVAKLKRAFKPDLVHINFTDPSVFFHLQTTDAHPAPMLVSIRVALPRQGGGLDTLLGQTLRSAHWVTANSAAVLAEAHRLVPEITTYSSLVYNGLDVPGTTPEPLPRDPPRLLCLGLLMTVKGFDLALTALASLAYRFPHIRLVIAGDGPARTELEKQADELGVSHLVDFVGWVTPENVPALMNGATVVVMPSRWEEAFGLVALEAALMARPVVATRVGGLPEVVVHGQTGLLVEKNDSRALGEAIAILLDDVELASKMGRAARSRAQEVFSLERHVDEYDGLYRQLVQNAAPGDSTALG